EGGVAERERERDAAAHRVADDVRGLGEQRRDAIDLFVPGASARESARVAQQRRRGDVGVEARAELAEALGATGEAVQEDEAHEASSRRRASIACSASRAPCGGTTASISESPE